MTPRLHGSIVTTLLILMTIVGAGFPASSIAQSTPDAASEPPVFILQPKASDEAYVTLEIEAGTSTESTVILGAEADSTVSALTFAADAYSLINGGFGVREYGEPLTSPTTWLDYEAGPIDLEPGQAIERSFTVSVPSDTEPGQYITGLIVQTAVPIAVGNSTMLQQTLRKAIAVLITVPGPLTPEFEIGNASLRQSSGSNALAIDIANTGNVLVKPAGDLTLTAPDGATVVTSPIALGSIYAGTSTQIELSIPTILQPGDYTVALNLIDPATDSSASVAALPLTVSDLGASSEIIDIVESFSVEPVVDASGEVQLANVGITFENGGGALPAVRSTLTVRLDGTVVEDYVVSSSLALPTGLTQLDQRYLPASGWQPGTYSFSLTIEAIDLASGQATVLQIIDAPGDIVVG